jgi:hypothetical protein
VILANSLSQERPYQPERNGKNGEPRKGNKSAGKKTFPARSKQGLVGDAA